MKKRLKSVFFILALLIAAGAARASASHLIDRGFTGHQMLDVFNLINMGGRVYDPVVQQFLSPDPYVQFPDNTQNLNRYAYCLNSPLMYTDPDGEWVQYVVGAIMGGISGWQIGKAQGAKGWEMAGYILGGAIIGTATAGIGTAVSSAVSTSVAAAGGTAMQSAVASGMIGGMVTNGINAAGMTALAGGNVVDVLGATIKGTVIGGFSGAAGAAAFQGMNNLLTNDIVKHIGKVTITIKNPLSSLPTNTLSYMAGSTASQVTTNLLNGRKPFQGVDYGLNLGILLPLTTDVIKYIPSFNHYIAKKNTTDYFPGPTTRADRSRYELSPSGDLIIKQMLYYLEYRETDFDEYIRVELWKTLFPDGIYERSIFVDGTFIPSYRNIIQSIYNFNIWKK